LKARIDICGPSPRERHCAIVVGKTDQPGYLKDFPAEFELYTLDASGLADQLAAHGPAPTRLSEYAFGAGALSVRHDYDLRDAPNPRDC
jgi:hypothetical protein